MREYSISAATSPSKASRVVRCWRWAHFPSELSCSPAIPRAHPLAPNLLIPAMMVFRSKLEGAWRLLGAWIHKIELRS